ncbi:108_t:CDS:2, partial [Racocetra fulgida]
DTSSFSTITEGLTTMLIEFKANQEKQNLDCKLDQIAKKISEKINKDLETIDNDIIRLMNKFLGDIIKKVKVLRERIHIKINQHLEWAKKKKERKLSIAKNIRRTYIYNLGKTPAAPHNRDVTEAYVKFFQQELKDNPNA